MNTRTLMPGQPTKLTIGRRLLYYRQLAGLSGGDVAAKLGVFRQRIHEYEKGLKEPSSIVLWRLAKALGVSTDDLLA